jgi:hypothetical protein
VIAVPPGTATWPSWSLSKGQRQAPHVVRVVQRSRCSYATMKPLVACVSPLVSCQLLRVIVVTIDFRELSQLHRRRPRLRSHLYAKTKVRTSIGAVLVSFDGTDDSPRCVGDVDHRLRRRREPWYTRKRPRPAKERGTQQNAFVVRRVVRMRSDQCRCSP